MSSVLWFRGLVTCSTIIFIFYDPFLETNAAAGFLYVFFDLERPRVFQKQATPPLNERNTTKRQLQRFSEKKHVNICPTKCQVLFPMISQIKEALSFYETRNLETYQEIIWESQGKPVSVYETES